MILLKLVVSLAVLGGATAQEPTKAETRVALENLKKADVFAGAAVGIAGVESSGVRDFRIVMRDTDAPALFAQLARDGTPAGRLYALAGLYLKDRPAFDKVASTAVSSDTKVNTMFGCMAGNEPAGGLLKSIASGSIPYQFAEQEPNGAWREKWEEARGVHEGHAIHLRRNASALRLKGDPRFATRFTVTVPLLKPDASGMPSSADGPSLQHINDVLLVRLQSSRATIATLIVTTNGRRDFIFHTSDAAWAEKVVAQVRTEMPARQFQATTTPDPNWNVGAELAAERWGYRPGRP